jgi:peptidoglycan hydrolase-like protein with peptidoglycan-binding domain
MAGIAVATVGGVALGGSRLLAPEASAAASPDPSPTTARATATVERRTLTVGEELDGTLGYLGSEELINQLSGTLTRTPEPGVVVRRGERLYELDGRYGPFLMYGSRPAWRRLDRNVPNGADVRQLETNLAEMGFLEADEVDRNWDADTTTAVKAWQTDAGVEADGEIELGEVIFLPSDLRVTESRATLGAPVRPGEPVLTGTTTTRVVAVELETDRSDLLTEGDRVEIGLPDGSSTTGTVSHVGRIATAEPTQTGEPGTPLITVTIAPDDAGATAAWDEAPVTVRVVRESRDGVLTVPVTALVALLEGGYAVEVVGDDGSSRYVEVELGIFEDGRVEVRSDELAEGDTVVVPS